MVEGAKLSIGGYIWVQGHAAAADGLEDTLAVKPFMASPASGRR